MKLILALWVSLTVSAANPLFHYEHETIELAGTLDLQTFAGPPNYESIAGGDQVERYFFLKLSQPIDVQDTNPKNKNAFDPQKNVKIMQLMIPAEDTKLWDRFRALGKGASVKIKGQLYPQLSGHHFSRVTFMVKELE